MANKKLSKNIFFNTLLIICQFIFPLITFPYLARILLPEGLGFVNFLDNIVQYLLFIAGLGIPIYGIREIARFKDDKRECERIYNDLLVINLISAFAIIAIYFLTILLFKSAIVNIHLYILASLIVIFNVFTIEWLFQGLEEFAYITKRSIAVKSISVILILLLVKNQNDLELYYFIMIGSYLLNSVININYAWRKFDLKINLRIVPARLKNHFKPILLIFSANVAISIFLYLDSFLLGILKNTEAVGYYVTAMKIVKIPVVVIGAFIGALVPKISHAVKMEEFDLVQTLIKKSFNYVVFLSVPLVVGIYLSSDFLIYILAGKNYANSVEPLKIMCPIILSLGLNNIFIWQILTPLSKEKYFVFTVIVGMIISVALNFFLIPLLSYEGTAISTLITETVICSISYYYSRKSFVYELEYSSFFKSILASIPMVGLFIVSKMFLHGLVLQSLVSITLSIVVYFLIQSLFFKNNFLKMFKSF
jgi:O-antigen/teichoic acid export membrane protein